MSYSNVIYTGDGATTDWAVPFPYLDKAHIAVTINGTATLFSWVGDATVHVSPAVANGLELRISRNSNRQARLANYADAQVLDEASMDDDALQLFYVAQEAFDAVSDSPSGGDMRRSMNLSDVYDLNAARLNLGALARAGDIMSGPLQLWGPPIAPNDAASKSYVDAILGAFAGAGVTSFNTRSGAVVLASADISSALGYTPVNKAGDTLLGPLVLAADPAVPLGAVTKQYVDARVGSTASTGEYVFGVPSPTYAAARLAKTVPANTSDRAGAANLLVDRTGGVPMVSFQNTYNVRTPNITTVGDIGMGANIVGFTNGIFLGFSGKGFGPRVNPGSTWAVYGGGFGVNERVGDQGFKRDRTGSFTMGLVIAPTTGDVGDGAVIGYNTTFGIGFTAATPGANTQRIWNPLFFELDCTVPNGIQIEQRGGSSAAMAPFAAVDIRDFFKCGIDMRGATFDAATDVTAIWLAQGQAIHYGPLQRIYVDPSGNLTFFDNIAGTKTLNSLGGGAGTNILPLNNVWTGTNKFDGTTADAVISGDPPTTVKASRTAPAGGVGGQVNTAFLCNTVTGTTSATFEWNALFRLQNNATGGENTALTTGAIKASTGHTWGMVSGVRDTSGGSSGNIYGIEVDLCSDGLSGGRVSYGVAVFYGADTNTFGSGSTTKQTAGVLVSPFFAGRNQLYSGVRVDGYADDVFDARASGLSAFRAIGAYSAAVIDISTVTSSPISIAFASGSRMNFASGVGNGSNQTWFAGGFVPNYVGAIEVLIDGAKRYIPIALNHP